MVYGRGVDENCEKSRRRAVSIEAFSKFGKRGIRTIAAKTSQQTSPCLI